MTNVNPIPGNTNVERNYSFTDQQPYGLSYYRISQTDRDGHKNYFQTIHVKLDITSALNVLHYTQGNYISLQISGAIPGNASIELYSIDGKKMVSQNIVLTKQISTYKINKQLPKGIYLLNIIDDGEKLYGGKVVVL